MKLKAVNAGFDDFIGIEKNAVFRVNFSGGKKQEIYKAPKSMLNILAYWPERGVAVIVDLSSFVVCLNVATGEEMWSKNGLGPIGGVVIWEKMSLVSLTGDDSNVFDAITGEKVLLAVGRIYGNSYRGVISHIGRAVYYCEAPPALTRLAGDPWCRFAVEDSNESLYLVSSDSKEGNSILVFNKVDGSLRDVVELPGCSFIRLMAPNVKSDGVVIFGYTGDSGGGFWRVAGFGFMEIGRIPRRDVEGLSRDGTHAIFRDGTILNLSSLE